MPARYNAIWDYQMAYTVAMVRLSTGHLLLAVAMAIVTGSVVAAQPRAVAPARVHVAIELDPFGGESYGAWSEVEVDQAIQRLPSGELVFTGLPRDVDIATLELQAINGQPAPPPIEQRFWPADDSPENHLQKHIGSQVTVTTTRGDVVGVLRAVDSDSIAVEVGAELRVLRRGAYVQDVRFANSTWQSTSKVIWRLPALAAAAATGTVSVRYRTRSISAGQNVRAVIDERASTVDLATTLTLHNRAEVGLGSAQISLHIASSAAGVQPTVRLPLPLELPPHSTVTVPMMTPLRHVKTTNLAVADAGSHGRRFEGRPECTWNDPINDGALAKAVEFVTPPGLRLARATVQVRMANATTAIDPDAPSWVYVAEGRGLITLGPSAVIIEHQQLDCTVDETRQTVRETIGIELTNKANQPSVVELNEALLRSSRWKLETSNLAATTTPDGIRFRTIAPGNSKKKLTFTVVYAW